MSVLISEFEEKVLKLAYFLIEFSKSLHNTEFLRNIKHFILFNRVHNLFLLDFVTLKV